MKQTELTPAGQERRTQIGDMLVERARQRRVGARVLGGIGSIGATAALLAVIVAVRTQTPTLGPTRTIVEHTPSPATPPSPPVPAPTRAERVIVRIVRNEPVPNVQCGAATAASAARGEVGVCVLNDTQLLAALSQTGESYGLVRIGGKARVVSNSAHE